MSTRLGQEQIVLVGELLSRITLCPGRLRYRYSYSEVYCVSSTDRGYNRVDEAAYGNLISGFAPGENVLVADHETTDSYIIESGTSFATPQVAAVAALMLGYEGFKRLSYA